jgi:hypothetical protein
MGEKVLEPCSKGGEESEGSDEEGDETSRREKKRGMVKCEKAEGGPRKRGSVVSEDDRHEKGKNLFEMQWTSS